MDVVLKLRSSVGTVTVLPPSSGVPVPRSAPLLPLRPSTPSMDPPVTADGPGSYIAAEAHGSPLSHPSTPASPHRKPPVHRTFRHPRPI